MLCSLHLEKPLVDLINVRWWEAALQRLTIKPMAGLGRSALKSGT